MKTAEKAKAKVPTTQAPSQLKVVFVGEALKPQAFVTKSGRPLSVKQEHFYFGLCELVVALYFGGEAMDYIVSVSRAKGGKAQRGPGGMRGGTAMAILRRLIRERGKLYPYTDNRPKPAKAA